jgi:hypothetical protein
MLDFFRCASGYPTYSTQARLFDLKASIACSPSVQPQSKSFNEKVLPEVYSPIKPRTDSLMGQTPHEVCSWHSLHLILLISEV